MYCLTEINSSELFLGLTVGTFHNVFRMYCEQLRGLIYDAWYMLFSKQGHDFLKDKQF